METTKLTDIVLTSTTGGKTSDLKGRFAAGSIPLDTDFSELIDIAECGRRAIGQSADQSDNSVGVGLALDTGTATATMGKLSVLAAPNGGISVSSSGVAVKVKSNAGIVVDGNGVGVKVKSNSPSGITVNSDGISVVAGACINLSSTGVEVLIGNGIMNSSNTVAVQAKNGGGLTVDSGGVAIDPGDCLEIKSNGLGIKFGNGVINSSDSIAVKAGSNITVDSNGVSVNIDSLVTAIANMIIPKGTIVPLYGSDVLPDGWAWCDGNNGTPNMNNKNRGYDKIKIISSDSSPGTDVWNLSSGDHLEVNVEYMKFIMKL